MVDVRFEESDEEFTCEGCGEAIPAFLDSCPYCDDPGEGDDLAPCPSCGVAIYDDAERCPVCAAWIVSGGAAGRDAGRRVALAVVAVVLVGALVYVFVVSSGGFSP